MVNLEHKITVDDLIVEYMIAKIKGGYEPNFLTSEFIDFLKFYEKQLEVNDTLYDGEKLFKRFFERKRARYWKKEVGDNIDHSMSHMDMIYSCSKNEYLVIPGYSLSDYDKSVVNTYFIPTEERDVIIKTINNYLKKLPKRTLNDETVVKKENLIIGKYTAALIADAIWLNHINKLIKYNEWPIQCKDINKYLFETNLAEIIDLKYNKEDLIKLYKVFAKRIAIMYSNDKNLEINPHYPYLAKSNYNILIKGYENVMNEVAHKNEKALNLKLNQLFSEETDKDSKTTNLFENKKIKTLVKNLDSEK